MKRSWVKKLVCSLLLLLSTSCFGVKEIKKFTLEQAQNAYWLITQITTNHIRARAIYRLVLGAYLKELKEIYEENKKVDLAWVNARNKELEQWVAAMIEIQKKNKPVSKM